MKKILIALLIIFLYNNIYASDERIKKYYYGQNNILIFQNNKYKTLYVKVKNIPVTVENLKKFFSTEASFEKVKYTKYIKIKSKSSKFKININKYKPGLYILKIYNKKFLKYYKVIISSAGLLAKKDENDIKLWFVDSVTGKPFNRYNILVNGDTIIPGKEITGIPYQENNLPIISFYSNSVDFLQYKIDNNNATNKTIEIITAKNDFYIGEFLNFTVLFRKKSVFGITTPISVNAQIIIKDKYNNTIVSRKVNNINNGIYTSSALIDDKFKEGIYRIIIKWGEYIKSYFIKIYHKRDNKYLFVIKNNKITYFNDEKINLNISIVSKFGALLNFGELKYEIWAKRFNEKRYKLYKTYFTDIDDGEAEIKFTPDFLKKGNYRVKIIFKIRANSGYKEGDYIILNVLKSIYDLEITTEKNIYEMGKEVVIDYNITKYHRGFIKKFFMKLYKVNNVKNKKDLILIETRKLNREKLKNSINIRVKKNGYYKAELILSDNYGNTIKKIKYFWIISYVYGINLKKRINDILIIPDKNSYKFSDIGKALIILPDKDMWVNISLERGKIYKQKYIFSEENFVLYDFPINEKYSPNVYLTVMAFKKGKVYYQTGEISVPKISKYLKLKTSLSNYEAYKKSNNKINVKIVNYWDHDVNSYLIATTLNNGFYNFYNINSPDILSKWFTRLKNNVDFLNSNQKAKKEKKRRGKKLEPEFVYSKYLLYSTLNYRVKYIPKEEEYNYRFTYNNIGGYWRSIFYGITENTKYGEASIISLVKRDIDLLYYTPAYCFKGDIFYFTVLGINYLPIRLKSRINFFTINGRYGSSIQKKFYIDKYGYNVLYVKTVPKVAKTLKIAVSSFLPEKIERKQFYIEVKNPEVVPRHKNKDLSVRKKYYKLKYRYSMDDDTYYSKLSSTGYSFDYGADILVSIRIRSKREFNNIKIYDFIPAGCEIIKSTDKFHLININPNLNYGKRLKKEKIVFTVPTINKGEYYIYYILKAKYKGSFTVPPLFIKQGNKIIFSKGKVNVVEIE